MADDHAGDPAQAFEDLRAEVSVLRRAIEALPPAIRENRPADYSADLGVLGKGLDEISGQLETVLKSPALVRTPEQQGQAIANAGANLIRESAGRLDQATRAAEQERARLASIVGQAWAQDRQFKLLCWTGGAAAALGLVLSPVIASVLPFGLNTRVAALVMRADRWAAGVALMQAADPQRWSELKFSASFVRDNQGAIEECRKAQSRSRKAQHCSLDLAPPSQFQPN